MTEIIGITVVGAALSGFIQWLKVKLNAEGLQVKLLTVALAMVVGAAYVLLRDTSLWPTILAILGAASTVYAFLLK